MIQTSLDRLTSAAYSTPSTGSGQAGEQFEYAYDAVGNRTVMTDATGVTTYTYDAANRLTFVGNVAYAWDNRGNLVSDGTFTYTYNSAGRMVRVESITSTLVYTYTADGLRVAQSVDGDVTTFAWDLAAPLAQVISDTDALYLHGLDLLAQQRGNAQRYYLADGLGSVRQMVNRSGAVKQRYDYTPYGVVLASQGSVANAFQYTGEWWDAYTNFTYLRARWYDAGVGRFTRRDPWRGNIQHPHTLIRGYIYVGNNPVSFSDPTGRRRWRATGNWYHTMVENHYEQRSPLGFLFKQLEYTIPGGSGTGRRPDMFNSFTGDVYEVEPRYRRWAGRREALQYALWLNEAAWLEVLERVPLGGGQVNDWNLVKYYPGLGADWPGKLRVSMLLAGYPHLDLVADYVEPGVVLYWTEPLLPDWVFVPIPFRVPNKRLMRPRNWNPPGVPVPVPAYVLAQTGCELLVVVGGAIIVVTLATDVTGIGVVDDIITVPAGLLLIDLGNRLAVLIPTTP